jgi:hypothetical protein
MNSDKRRTVRFDLSFNQSDELFVADKTAKSDDAKLAKFCGEIGLSFFFSP